MQAARLGMGAVIGTGDTVGATTEIAHTRGIALSSEYAA